MLTTQEKRERALKLIDGGMTTMAAVKKVGISYGALYYKPKSLKMAKVKTKRLPKEHLPLVLNPKTPTAHSNMKTLEAAYVLIEALNKFIAMLSVR